MVEDLIPVLTAREWMALKDWDHDHMWEGKRQSAEADADEAASRLGVPVEVSAVISDPGHELRTLSESVDVIVVGSRRWSPLARLVTGSVGETLVADAACSVVIVPRSAEVQTAASERQIAEPGTTGAGTRPEAAS